jgi:hypothetical protein
MIGKPMSKPLKAYSVQEKYEGTGGILFAKHAIVAHRNGAHEYGDGELSYVTCRRAPWADAYAETALPARVMVEHGWWFECHGCGIKISEDEFDDLGMKTAGIIGTQHGRIFCCAKCKWRDMRIEKKRKAQEREAFEVHKAIVLQRFPGVNVLDFELGWPKGSHVYVTHHLGGWDWTEITIEFEFPGMKIAPASMKTRREYGERTWFTPPQIQFYCCNGDREAFEAFAAACKEAKHV